MPINTLEIEKAQAYEKAIKKLKKRFRSVESDVESFLDSISTIEELGINLTENVYKVRIANSNKNSGKSGGYRLISYLRLVENKLILVYIYDKSDFENISESEIDRLVLDSIIQ